MKRHHHFAAIAMLAMSATAAAAQQGDWSYEATVYLFTPETKTGLSTPDGSVNGSLSFADALENLDLAFMGAFGASTGRWGAYLDYLYTSLSFRNATPNGTLDSDLTTQILSGYVTYRVHETPVVQLDMAAGVRWFSTDTELTLRRPEASDETRRLDDDWIDPVVGLRARVAMTERWSGTAFVDYGGFRSDSETWQALLTADYALTPNWVLRGGYRYISVDHDTAENGFSFSQSGVVFGAAYRF
ncbi:outer membrane protein [Dinoroseobacter shibae]|jgi:hypothetical protein|nr:outer membrane beta-barrel protein [Dinoroseobacter shibae]URF47617.1 opacity family porin [Dinoroseobacter shibae]URF51927.1 opacity family porin [Dinoroseobacter shibae]